MTDGTPVQASMFRKDGVWYIRLSGPSWMIADFVRDWEVSERRLWIANGPSGLVGAEEQSMLLEILHPVKIPHAFSNIDPDGGVRTDNHE